MLDKIGSHFWLPIFNFLFIMTIGGNMKKISTSLVIFLVSITLMGCATRQQTGTLLGGVTGGLIGSQIGSGSGRVVATGVGAVAGGLVGGEIGRSSDYYHRY